MSSELIYHVTALIVGAILMTAFSFIAVGLKNWQGKDYKELGGFIISLFIYFELTYWITELMIYIF